MDRSQPRRSQCRAALQAARAPALARAGRSGRALGPPARLSSPESRPGSPVTYASKLLIGLAGLSVSVGPGCAPPPVKSVDNPDPSGKIPAIKEAAERHDLRAVPPMIRDLDDNDPAVRFFAIQGLQRITGETFGYRYYDDEAQRQPSIRRWQQWWAGRHK